MTLQVGGGGISLSLVGTQVVGVNRDATVRVTLPQAAPAGGVTVTVTSDNTGILTVSAPGAVSIPEGQTIGQVTVNGVSAGTTVLRGNATGFTEGSLSVTVTLNLISMPTTLNVPLGQTTNLPVTIAPDPAPAGGVVVNVISSDPSGVRVDTPTVTIPQGQLSANATVFGAGIGSVTVNGSSPNYAADVTATSTTASINIVEGNQTINNSFGGNITVRLESPPGTAFAAPAGGVQVTGAGITLSGMEAVGSGLMGTANTATLGASNHGGVTVRIASSNPTVALVSPNASTVGTAFFDAAVANGSTQASFVVHGVEGVTGTVTVTASAPGFTDGTGAATIVQPALRLAGLAATTTALAGNDDFVVQVGVPTAGNTTLNAVRAVRAGSAGVTATVSNSAATVGQLVTIPGSAQTRTVAIAAGQSASPASLAAGGVQFDPLAGGTTQVSGSIPGFITTTAGNVTVTVTP
jgi:hypothetical protein